MGFAQFDEQKLMSVYQILDDTTTPGEYTFFQSQPFGARVDSLLCLSTDTVDHTIGLAIHLDGYSLLLGQVLVPAHAGSLGIPGVEMITEITSPLMGCILLFDGFQLAMVLDATPNAGKQVAIWGQGGNF